MKYIKSKIIKSLRTRFLGEAICKRLPRRPENNGLLAMTVFNKVKVVSIFSLLIFSTTFSQTGSTLNTGVDKYEKGDFAGASEKFQKSIDEKFENYKGHFNLGDALYKQEKYEDALNAYKNAMALAETDEQKAEVFHNVGNSLLKSQKLKESVGAYTESLKLNPADLETKYNLSYALKQMQQEEQNKDKNEDKDDKKNEDKKDDQKKDQNKDDQKKDENKDKDDKQDQQNQDKEDDKKEEQQKNQQQQQPPPEISKAEAQRILDALEDDEAEMQKELRKKKGKKVKVEKDW
ncbi:MAG: tetratricopeptide repeat protein [Melioribacteraceae bacterium]|jgi:Ca-activated chloride channel family protein|nr:tetratricopeptide repeat protein [Melioribacteraceae bacterium]